MEQVAVLERRRTFSETSPIEPVLLRQELNRGRYIKCQMRDPEKSRILIELALEKARQVDADCFEKIGERRRRVTIP
ncbi:MAG TPA: hypothetical protein HPP76_11270 [Desulfuromonadales bacterium]|nr:hypothetical protein [Desulfuromonadales bacterium]